MTAVCYLRSTDAGVALCRASRPSPLQDTFYLPTYSPWLNPIEMLWRHFRREVTHCELFTTVKALLDAARDFFARYNQHADVVLSIIGAHPTQVA